MAKLLTFLACEKVVISQEENSASLVAILQGFTLVAPLPSEGSVSLPIPWYVFALWDGQPNEPRARQKFELLSPTGAVLESGESDLFETSARFHRVLTHILGFPVVGPGEYILRLSLMGDDGAFKEVAQFPIPVMLAPGTDDMRPLK